MDYELFYEGAVKRIIEEECFYSFSEIINSVEIWNGAKEIMVCTYYDCKEKMERLAVVIATEEGCIWLERKNIPTNEDLFYDDELEKVYTESELFNEWKQGVTDKEQSFKDYIESATNYNESLVKIYY